MALELEYMYEKTDTPSTRNKMNPVFGVDIELISRYGVFAKTNQYSCVKIIKTVIAY